ncbi:MAG: phosphotransferase [Propionibacteriaceae bacterium]
MQEAPPELTDIEVLAVVRAAWNGGATAAEHLPVGFGAHHWRVDVAGQPSLFATYDRFGKRHSLDSLTAAYAGAVRLADAGLEFVLAPSPTRDGQVAVPVAGGALSCTPWVDGRVVGEGPVADFETAAANIADLARLHAAEPPARLPSWSPVVGPDVADRLAGRVTSAWPTGPYGEPSRRAIAGRLVAIEGWSGRYLALAEAAADRQWVVTHGETHTRNQVWTQGGIRFVDWESLKLAPRERDLSTLVQAGYGERVTTDRDMVELFDLEWRLAEIAEYADWFAAPHTGTTDDRTAYEGLLDELDRAPWWPPA